VPGAEPVGPATLGGYRLEFAKRSVDGSAKCTVVEDPAAVVHGVVFRLPAEQRVGLDRAEGLGRGYDERLVRVEGEAGARDVFLYVANADWLEEGLPAYRWYLEFVIAGAREHGLPAAWIEGLRRARAIDDPDSERQLRNRRIARLA